MRNTEDITSTIEMYGDTVLRICTLYFGSRPEREDAFQETFLKYVTSDKVFNDDEHLKAWLITVATNTCKDMLRKKESKVVLIDEFNNEPYAQPDEQYRDSRLDDLACALSHLDEKSRTIIYLIYYEKLSACEVAKIVDMTEGAVYTNASRARKKLREVIEDVRQS